MSGAGGSGNDRASVLQDEERLGLVRGTTPGYSAVCVMQPGAIHEPALMCSVKQAMQSRSPLSPPCV